eukprot:366109-Chlamydomonas_euryale.AAC.3
MHTKGFCVRSCRPAAGRVNLLARFSSTHQVAGWGEECGGTPQHRCTYVDALHSCRQYMKSVAQTAAAAQLASDWLLACLLAGLMEGWKHWQVTRGRAQVSHPLCVDTA